MIQQWLCPICDSLRGGDTIHCRHGEGDFSKGVSVWYAGRILHFTADEVGILRKARSGAKLYPHEDLLHLTGLGFLGRDGAFHRFTLTAEGENLCRHLGLAYPQAPEPETQNAG